MKMRDYVDAIQGVGSWDRMQDAIERQELFGWSLPPVDVDGRRVNIFPGTDREAMLEDVQEEIRKVFAAIDAGEFVDMPPTSGIPKRRLH